MARIVFTANLKRHVDCPELQASGRTVRDVLEAALCERERLRSYVLDDQSRLRQHMVIFIDGQPIQDRVGLSDLVQESSEIYIMQALSGG